MESDYSDFQLKEERNGAADVKMNPSEVGSEVRRIRIEGPEALPEGAKAFEMSEDANGLGDAKSGADQFSRRRVSREIKLIKSLAAKLGDKNSGEKVPSPETGAEAGAFHSLNGGKPEARSETFPDEDEESRKPGSEVCPELSPASSEEGRSPADDFKYEAGGEDSMGIPFDAFDLSDFRLDDILGGGEDDPSDDILKDDELLRELYGCGERREDGNSEEAEMMKDIETVGGKRFETKTDGILKKEEVSIQSRRGKFSAVLISITLLMMVFVAGVRPSHMLASLAGLSGMGVWLVLGKAYRMRRITGFLDPWADPLDSGFCFGIGGYA